MLYVGCSVRTLRARSEQMAGKKVRGSRRLRLTSKRHGHQSSNSTAYEPDPRFDWKVWSMTRSGALDIRADSLYIDRGHRAGIWRLEPRVPNLLRALNDLPGHQIVPGALPGTRCSEATLILRSGSRLGEIGSQIDHRPIRNLRR